jgi:uncharacterized protein YjdB
MMFTHKLAKRLALLKDRARDVVAAVPAAAARLGLVFGLGLGLATCDKPLVVTGAKTIPVASVAVSPASLSIVAGSTGQLTATPADASGNPLSGRTVTWQTNPASVATVSASGMVTAVAAGAATISATSEGKSGTAAVTVAPVPVASVAVSPATATVLAGNTVQLAATPKAADGDPLAGRTVTWTSSNPAVATVNSSGLVTAVAAGTVTITATCEGKSGTATITVTTVPVASVTVAPSSANLQVSQTVQLTATPKDASGNPLSGRVVTWATSSAAVATVSGSGLVTAVAAGTATITATSEGQSGTAAITVTSVPVASVVVTPASATVPAGSSVQLTATPEDASGNPLAGRVVTWASSNTAVATVSGSGFVTGVAQGAATITATSEGKNGTAAITVSAPPPPGTTVVLVGAGDIGNCSSEETATTTLLAGIAGTVFTAGDNAYPSGYLSDFMSCYDPYWGQQKARTRPAPGNHEYNDDHSSSAPGYYDYFGPIVGDSAHYWYSYDLGAWHIVVINSWLDMTVGSPQETWLKADLAASTKRCTLAYDHYPRFSSGATHGSYSALQPIWQDLYDHGAEIMVSGHDHEYERFAPQTPTGLLDTVRGIRQFVVGTGGAGLYSFATPLPNSEVRNNSTWGVLKLSLSDSTYTWQFIPIAGQTFTDSGSGTCH